MNRIWGRETLRFVDSWACKDGTPEDDEDIRNGVIIPSPEGDGQLKQDVVEKTRENLNGHEVV